MDSGIDLARVFRVAATSCERGRVTATSAEIREDMVEEPSSTSIMFEETTWQAATARMKSLPARPAIDRESIVPGVCMMDNRSGLFCLVSSTGQVYVPARVLLDFGAQPLMLGKAACISLGIRSRRYPVCENMEEVVRFAAVVPSPLDVPLWSSCQALQLEADRLVKKAWTEACLPAEAERFR
ncbi:hypothetical protein AXG93_3228s1010 [Marchantia polymorpha subsp. ruderalis]|uniref:Uncharacterized protein n=1 Tax=Marchantia polymorpha subsp. ruderalis TaxID=1480154 RepID=A0A176WI50_MARPO|nr:hypothetical protein AXG93_3228s1010 [Marchantia polymorpha subsp. ruderalis]